MFRMIFCARFVLLSAIVFTGCRTAHDVAVTSFRVLDAPARYVRDRIDQPQTTTTTTTTTETSDVTNPGQPVPAAPERAPSPTRRTVVREEARPSQPRHSESATTQQHKTTPSSTPRVASKQTPQFPTARPVPGQPGHVYSIDPKGGIVDVTGYKKGDRAKDPYTQQIFIVP